MCKLPAFSIANKLLTLGEKNRMQGWGRVGCILILTFQPPSNNFHRSIPSTVWICSSSSIWKWSLSLPVLFLKWPSNCAAVSFSHLWLLRETEVRSICLVLYSGNIIKPLNNAYKVNVKTEEAYRSYFWMLLKLDRIK